MISQTISHYKIIKELGSGGMGTVYKAQDTKLKRPVVLKFLPPELTRDPEAKERFIHEAQAASQLDHPNICTVYEINETTDGQLFIAMGYYKGETLRKKIEQRPLKLGEASDITTQIAKGLAKAHEAAIIHRDIKPANIIITENEEVKILDFGLAKLTGQTKLTRLGTTVGTVAYMSPEQMRGDKVDHRTDIWSLGVVMYEMLTGQVPFKGDYEQAITYSILNEEPEPITALRTGIPIALESVVNKAMAKDPKQRYQHVDEITVDLGRMAIDEPMNLATILSGRSSISITSLKAQYPLWILMAAILFGLVIGVVFVMLWKQNIKPVSHYPIHFTIPIESGGGLDWMWRPIDISTDGRYLAYTAVDTSKGVNRIYVHSMENLIALPVPESENGNTPFFSPDGNWLGFFVNNELKRFSVKTGKTVSIVHLGETADGADWTDEDQILVSCESYLLSVSPITAEIDTIIDEYWGSIYPQFLPQFESIIFTRRNSWRKYDCQFAVLPHGARTPIIMNVHGSGFRYIHTGHLLFIRKEGLFIAELDLNNRRITKSPKLAIPDVGETTRGGAEFAISQSGILAYIAGREAALRPVWVTCNGREIVLPLEAAEYWTPRILKNGKEMLATVESSGGWFIWVYNLHTGQKRRLTFDASIDSYPLILPDGEHFIYISDLRGGWDAFRQRIDGMGDPELIFDSHVNSVSHDGMLLSFIHDGDIFVLDIKSKKTNRITNTPSIEKAPTFCPTGSWIAYVSDESGQNEIWIQGYPKGARHQVSLDGGTEPVWSPKGTELYFRTHSAIMSAAIDPATGSPSQPRELFIDKYVRGFWDIPHYDIDPVTGRFLMLKREVKTEAHEIHVVLNRLLELD
jgi:serine/threonine protein kinase